MHAPTSFMRVLHLEPARCASLHGSRGFHRDLPVRTDRKEVGLESGSGETFMVTKSSLPQSCSLCCPIQALPWTTQQAVAHLKPHTTRPDDIVVGLVVFLLGSDQVTISLCQGPQPVKLAGFVGRFIGLRGKHTSISKPEMCLGEDICWPLWADMCCFVRLIIS